MIKRVVILGALILVVLIYVSPNFTVDTADTGTELPVVLSLASNDIPELHPHKHTAHDTVSDTDHGVLTTASEIVTEKDMWVRGIHTVIENAPHSTLHHMNIMVFPPPETATEGSFLSSEFARPYGFSVGQDIAETVTLTRPYATFLPKGTRLVMTAMLHNPQPPKGPGGTYYNVRITSELLGLDFPEEKAERVWQIYLTLIDADSPRLDSFTVPAQTPSFTRYAENENDVGRSKYTFPADGTLIDMSAHVHAWEGGTQVEAYINGENIQTFTPHLTSTDAWDWRTERKTLMRKVKKGDVLSLSATYTNEGTESLRGAMGSIGASFAPDLPSKDFVPSFIYKIPSFLPTP